MALRRALGKPRFLLASPTAVPPNAAKTNFHREYITSPDSSAAAAADDRANFFRRFLHRRALSQRPVTIPEFLSIPVGDKLREKLRSINITGDRIRIDGVAPPKPEPESPAGLSVQDAKKLLRFAQVEKLKSMLREIPETAIPYTEFVRVCAQGCGNENQAVEFAKMLDDSGNVIVLGSIVFLRPEQVAKSMESIISENMAFPKDPRRRELEEMEKQKLEIDEKARAQVKGELYCGLGFLSLQMMGFMRLTFWELSWDVMEPICFFVTSLHFAGAYAFFLRTATEPTFEGYFNRRFKTKQRRLMDLHSFDLDKYNNLRRACHAVSVSGSGTFGRDQEGAFLGAMNR